MVKMKIERWFEKLPEPIKSKLENDMMIYGNAYLEFSVKVVNPLDIIKREKVIK